MISDLHLRMPVHRNLFYLINLCQLQIWNTKPVGDSKHSLNHCNESGCSPMEKQLRVS